VPELTKFGKHEPSRVHDGYPAIWLSGHLAIQLYQRPKKPTTSDFFLKHIPDADNPFIKQYKYNF
jgi:hypothetical protein